MSSLISCHFYVWSETYYAKECQTLQCGLHVEPQSVVVLV